MKTASDRIVMAAFLGGGLFGAVNGVAIRFSNRELAPLWGASLRFLIAGLLLTIIMFLQTGLACRQAWAGAVLWGLLQFGQFGLVYLAFLTMQAGVGQTLLALVPLATLLLAVAQGQERIRLPAIIGSLLGVAGIAVISLDLLKGSVPLLSVLAVLGSVLCIAEASVLARRLPRMHPVALSTVGMLASTVVLLSWSFLLGEPRLIPQRLETWAALAYLGSVGSIAVFLLYLYVIMKWSASRAAYVMLLIPFATVALSAWLDGEQ
jgi:drug/metabolite transporter (DMT)-like permease